MGVHNNRIAVLIPCFNESRTIAKCVLQFRAALPDAVVYVYDNNSTDNSVDCAREAGAVVRREKSQGKGNVVRRMFADIESDIYLLVDGDATYDPTTAPALVDAVAAGGYDMVVARRLAREPDAYRRGHRFGNRVLTYILGFIFGQGFRDALSGYRAFSRRFIKSFPGLARGFEIEVELTIHALGLRLPVREIDAPYMKRPDASTSKLNTWRDGMKILLTIVHLFRSERPFGFFMFIAIVLALLSVALAIPLFRTYMETGLVPRFPTAILSASIMILAVLSVACGVILDTVTRGRREMKRLHYLSIPRETPK